MNFSCIIPSAGKSSRFLELGKHFQKGILPINGTPIIVSNIKLLIKHGVNEIVIVTKDASQFDRVFKMYSLENYVKYVKPDDGVIVGPLVSIISGWRQLSIVDNILIVLSDILLEEFPKFPNGKETRYVTYESKPDFTRWCLISKYDGSLLDKPKSNRLIDDSFKHYSGGYNAINGVYWLNFDDQKLIDIHQKNNHDEYQISSLLNKLKIEPLYFSNIRDIGTIDDYFKKKNECRYFNDLTIENGIVRKTSSSENNKIINEYNWYKNLPLKLKKYIPQVYQLDFQDDIAYNMEELLVPTMRDFVVILGCDDIFNDFISSVDNFISLEKEFCYNFNLKKFILDKTVSRMKDAEFETGDIQKMSDRILNLSISETSGSIMHGDMVFSNIFFDLHSKNIKLIDPKGMMIGSWIYDLAKLHQCFKYDYDFIDMGLYVYTNDHHIIFSDHLTPIKEKWNKYILKTFGKQFMSILDTISLSLIASLISLHKDKPMNCKVYKDIVLRELNEI